MFRPRGPQYELPTPDPDSPPDSLDPGGPCPRCGRTSTFEILGWLPLTFDYTMRAEVRGGEVPAFEAGERVTVLKCRGCNQCTAVVEERWIGQRRAITGMGEGGTIYYRGVFWWPPASVASLDKAIPKPIGDAFAEGAKCLAVQAPRGAAAMFRRTLEAIVTDKGSMAAQKSLGNSLYDGLKVMTDERALDPNLASWAKEIRLAGNVGAHYDVLDDVTMDEASELSKLIWSMFLYLYETPAKLRRSQPKPATTP